MRLPSNIDKIKKAEFQSTHPLRDATRMEEYSVIRIKISIHAPLTGCDERFRELKRRWTIFQSTHPLRDATETYYSIGIFVAYFNPRTPYGMRLSVGSTSLVTHLLFQSTHPLRDATKCSNSNASFACYFNPRTPYGMRH